MIVAGSGISNTNTGNNLKIFSNPKLAASIFLDDAISANTYHFVLQQIPTAHCSTATPVLQAACAATHARLGVNGYAFDRPRLGLKNV